MRALALAVVSLSLACKTSAPVEAPVVVSAPPPFAASTPDLDASRGPAWTSFPVGGVSAPIGDVGALDGGEAILLAGSGIFRWRNPDAVEPVCVSAREQVPGVALLSVQADGDRFVVLGGDEAEPVVWRSDDRGARCQRVRVPALFIRDAPRGAIQQTLHGAHAFVWSTTGAIVRSDDGGQTWRRLTTLPGVVDLAPGPAGSAIAAVAAGDAGERLRARLYALDQPSGTWHPVEGAELLYTPVTLQSLSDGGTLVGHGAGTLTLDASLVARARRVDPASRYTSHRPGIVAVAGEGRFLGATSALLYAIDASATEAVAAIPGAQAIHAIDASRDGWLWVTDGRGLWRGRYDAPFVEVSAHPLGGEAPAAFAARGARLLVVGSGRAAYRSDPREPWHRLTVPASVGRVLSAHIDEQGTLYALGSTGLAVSDAGEFAAVPAPSVPSPPSGATQFAAMGDRWVIAGGAVYTSDDHGAQWEPRLGHSYATPPSAPVMFGNPASPQPVVLASVLDPGGSVLALDLTRSLSRSDDAATTFTRVASLPTPEGPAMLRVYIPSVLAWDGARRIAVLHRDSMVLSADGGRTFSAASAPFVARWATFSGATLVASGSLSDLLPVACRHDDAQTLFVYTPDGWLAGPDACAHRGSLVAHDGDAVWLLDPAMNLQRASLSRLVRSLTGR